jgi:thioredoxin reductase (NADPH)
VAGDLRSKKFRQITTAVADGTIAALAAQKYLKDRRPAAPDAAR